MIFFINFSLWSLQAFETISKFYYLNNWNKRVEVVSAIQENKLKIMVLQCILTAGAQIRMKTKYFHFKCKAKKITQGGEKAKKNWNKLYQFVD